jgi:hypothetical protein
MFAKFCNNCGENGHSYQICKHPITSIGIIAYRYKEHDDVSGAADADSDSDADANSNDSSNIEYLMIRRKDTLGFVDFMRGRYSISNKRYIVNIINEMTMDEKHRLLAHTFDELWTQLWGNNIARKYKNEEHTSR